MREQPAITAETTLTRLGPVEHARTGRGPAVLLVHGTPGNWRQLVPLAHDLSDRFTAIIPSRPGYGATPLSAGRTFSEQASCYAALLDALRIEDAAVVGVSGGGPSALAFAYTAPARAVALCCAVAPHLVHVPAAMRIAAAAGPLGRGIATAARAVQRRRARGKTASELVGAALTPDDRMRLGEPGVAEALESFVLSHAEAPTGFEGMRNDIRRFIEADEAPDLSGLRLPALVQHGTVDPTVPIDHGRFHATAIPGAELDVYDGAGHLYLVTRRREATARIRSFLERAL